MLLRSNNDYIDHTYWPTVQAESVERHKRIIERYGMPDVRRLTEEPSVLAADVVKYNREMGMGKRFIIEPTPPTKRIPLLED